MRGEKEEIEEKKVTYVAAAAAIMHLSLARIKRPSLRSRRSRSDSSVLLLSTGGGGGGGGGTVIVLLIVEMQLFPPKAAAAAKNKRMSAVLLVLLPQRNKGSFFASGCGRQKALLLQAHVWNKKASLHTAM